MTQPTSSIAHYCKQNPDILQSGCTVTGKVEEGIVFPSLSPEEGNVMFIGKTALTEAVAAYLSITVDDAAKRLAGTPEPKRAELNAMSKRLDAMTAKLAKWDQLKAAMADAGMVITAFED